MKCRKGWNVKLWEDGAIKILEFANASTSLMRLEVRCASRALRLAWSMGGAAIAYIAYPRGTILDLKGVQIEGESAELDKRHGSGLPMVDRGVNEGRNRALNAQRPDLGSRARHGGGQGSVKSPKMVSRT